jgi:cell division septal protein FtsQ
MFGKKRKLKKFKYAYGKSPTLSDNSPRKYRSPQKPFKNKHPLIAKIKRIFYLSIFGLAIVLLIYFVFFSNYFVVTDITIAEANIENQALGEEITGKISQALGKNIIFVDTEELETKILDYFPELEEVKINKDYPRKLEIEFYEYPLIANIINESTTVKKTYIINSIGYAIKENFENPNLPYIKIKSDEPLNTENAVIEASKLKYILDTITYFEDKFGMRIIEIQYKKTAREVHLLTERNFYIWLDIQRPAEEQLKKLKKALVKLDIYSEDLEYIDLRIAGSNGDKIIYKRR